MQEEERTWDRDYASTHIINLAVEHISNLNEASCTVSNTNMRLQLAIKSL